MNVGVPRAMDWRGRIVRSGIVKSPVNGRVRVVGHNVEGDRQADLRVHGGERKAVYAYPAEHYAFWRERYPDRTLEPGAFGENLSTEGVLESNVAIGDVWRVGSTELRVTEPRMPCFKLGVRFEDDAIVAAFLQSGRTGFYFAVVKEGGVAAGDAIERLSTEGHGVTIAEVVDLHRSESPAEDRVRRAAAVESLAPSWRRGLLRKLDA